MLSINTPSINDRIVQNRSRSVSAIKFDVCKSFAVFSIESILSAISEMIIMPGKFRNT
jgi:hypothetical protein